MAQEQRGLIAQHAGLMLSSASQARVLADLSTLLAGHDLPHALGGTFQDIETRVQLNRKK